MTQLPDHLAEYLCALDLDDRRVTIDPAAPVTDIEAP